MWKKYKPYNNLTNGKYHRPHLEKQLQRTGSIQKSMNM